MQDSHESQESSLISSWRFKTRNVAIGQLEFRTTGYLHHQMFGRANKNKTVHHATSKMERMYKKNHYYIIACIVTLLRCMSSLKSVLAIVH